MDVIKKLQNFKNSKGAIPYAGLSKPELKANLSALFNQAADDFIVTTKNKPSEKKYQEDIKRGLSRFNSFYLDLDTEDGKKYILTLRN